MTSGGLEHHFKRRNRPHLVTAGSAPAMEEGAARSPRGSVSGSVTCRLVAEFNHLRRPRQQPQTLVVFVAADGASTSTSAMNESVRRVRRQGRATPVRGRSAQARFEQGRFEQGRFEQGRFKQQRFECGQFGQHLGDRPCLRLHLVPPVRQHPGRGKRRRAPRTSSVRIREEPVYALGGSGPPGVLAAAVPSATFGARIGDGQRLDAACQPDPDPSASRRVAFRPVATAAAMSAARWGRGRRIALDRRVGGLGDDDLGVAAAVAAPTTGARPGGGPVQRQGSGS